MKRWLTFILGFACLFILSANKTMPSSDSVTVQGTVYLWNLDNAHDATSGMGDFDDIPGGEYVPASDLFVEVEFGWLNNDLDTYTNANGHYSVTKSNPWWGKYNVDVEVRADAFLDAIDPTDPNTVMAFPAGTDLVLFYEGRLNIYPYNGQTAKVSVGPDETVTIDVYVGGPGKTGGYRIDEWYDENPGDHLLGFYSVETIREAYRWATSRAISAEDIARSTSLMYPIGDQLHYAPFSLPVGTGHIEIPEQDLYPDEVLLPFEIGKDWQEYRGSLIHEYGHKIMHDVYTVLPMDFQEPKCTGHGISSEINGECGWVEGWAEFFSAAVVDRPTANGSLNGSNLEHTYHTTPDSLYDAGNGSFDWRNQVSDNGHDICEGENAAVLWDIFDQKGWEYMLPVHQDTANALIPAWPKPLRWYDRLHDYRLEDIWSILRDEDPDRLTDEGASFEFTNDGFWKYWRDKFSSTPEKIHGLKAVLYNREIDTKPLSETAPLLEVTSVDTVKHTAQVTIVEKDAEDRPYLYYNVAYRKGSASTLRIFHNTDTLLADLDGEWQGNVLTVDVPIPSANMASELVFMVHDNMVPTFTNYSLSGDSGGGETWQELTLSDEGKLKGIFGGEMEVRNGLLYVAAGENGLRIYDINTKPASPAEVGVLEENDLYPLYVGLEGDYAYLASLHDGVYQVNISQPAKPVLTTSIFFDPPADVTTRDLVATKSLVFDPGGYLGLRILQGGAGGSLALQGGYESDDCTVASDVVVYQNTIYLVCEYTGLHVLDISTDLTTPDLIGTWKIENPSPNNNGVRLYEDIFLDAENKRLYLSITWDGVYVLDISNPRSPTVQAVIKTTGAVMSLDYADGIIYTAEGFPYGVTAIDIHDLANPIELDYLELPDSARFIKVNGSYAYIASSYGSMRLVKISK